MQFPEKEPHLEIFPSNFSEVFKTYFQKRILVLGVLLTLQPVDCEGRRGTSCNIPMQVIEFSTELYNFTLLKSDFVTNALLTFLKILGILTGNICNRASF